MPDIVYDFIVKAPADRVFSALTAPAGLDTWWTKTASGTPGPGAELHLGFGPGYDWRGTLTRYEPDSAFELHMTGAHEDWMDTRVGATLTEAGGTTTVRFYHTGWPAANEHWRISCYCWAMYLRLLRRNVEHGELVPYERRLDV